MKKLIVLGGIGIFFSILFFSGCGSYNNLVRLDKGATAQWSQVENAYQRRNDLIPNLVAVVKNYADFEKSTLEAVINARASATKITIDPSKLDGESLKKFQQAQGEVSSALGRLLVVSENYPNLKANQNFLDLQTQLEGTENRISNERRIFIEAIQAYNTAVSLFPGNIFAGMF